MTGEVSEVVTPSKRTQTPTRFRRANSNAKLATIQDTIEEMMGLPSGSIRLVRPSGRKVRSDATVGTLREHWGE